MTPLFSPFGKKTIYATDLFEKEGDKVRTVFLIGGEKVASEEEEGGESRLVFHHSDHLGGASLDTDRNGGHEKDFSFQHTEIPRSGSWKDMMGFVEFQRNNTYGYEKYDHGQISFFEKS